MKATKPEETVLNYSLLTAMLFVAGLGLSGCAPMIAGAIAVSTPEEIKSSAYTARFTVDSSQAAVTSCLKDVLLAYKNEKGRASYAAFTYRDATSPHQIVVSNNVSSSWSGARPELLFLIETQELRPAATDLQLWVHQRLLNSSGFLDSVQTTLRPCLVGSLARNAPALQAPLGRSQQDENSFKKLEQLKALLDRGVITKEDYDKKKKEILDAI